MIAVHYFGRKTGAFIYKFERYIYVKSNGWKNDLRIFVSRVIIQITGIMGRNRGKEEVTNYIMITLIVFCAAWGTSESQSK